MKIVGVNFKAHGKMYYFDANDLKLKEKDDVIVDTERGVQLGKVVKTDFNPNRIKANGELKKVVRLATVFDFKIVNKNAEDSVYALKVCRDIVNKYHMEMQIIDASYSFDRSQLVFKFLADNRVDFRILAKELAGIFKTRIELRQVGARDKAKEVTGYGMCGCKLCCSRFLNDLDSVSINMAKNQGLSLTPSKINGLCGRLLCCLKYEDECYRECNKTLPSLGKKVTIPEGTGKVISLDILKGKYKVYIPEKGIVEVDSGKRN